MQFGSDPLKNHHRYRREETLGRGNFGTVVRAFDTVRNEDVAIKILSRAGTSKYVENEAINHSMLRHPHVIEFREIFCTKEHICIVLEYASGGNLLSYVQHRGRLVEAESRWFFQQLIIGVDYCHRCGIANRDIKLENTLLQQENPPPMWPLLKICDFGFSIADEAAKSTVGTFVSMAPEVLTGQAYDSKLADVWSCGVMLYVMLYGRYPFGNCDSPADLMPMLSKMRQMDFPMPETVQVSAACRSLLREMLQPDPSRRIPVAKILKHAWFLEGLPEGAGSMNDEYMQKHTSHTETTMQIKRLFRLARGTAAVPMAGQCLPPQQAVQPAHMHEEQVLQGCCKPGGPQLACTHEQGMCSGLHKGLQAACTGQADLQVVCAAGRQGLQVACTAQVACSAGQKGPQVACTAQVACSAGQQGPQVACTAQIACSAGQQGLHAPCTGQADLQVACAAGQQGPPVAWEGPATCRTVAQRQQSAKVHAGLDIIVQDNHESSRVCSGVDMIGQHNQRVEGPSAAVVQGGHGGQTVCVAGPDVLQQQQQPGAGACGMPQRVLRRCRGTAVVRNQEGGPVRFQRRMCSSKSAPAHLQQFVVRSCSLHCASSDSSLELDQLVGCALHRYCAKGG